ncbi:YqzL family protein [Cohnella sp. REN36]|uniref:YqzL family protein n=1 Tax=Cohnella sp. REN36 TaxID=2887347 RepID=UPI001D132E17|nr:YqzL family protein [Cohnella sp. REN36]
MRDFTWHVFTQTGDIEAYLLYKEMHMLGTDGSAKEPAPDRDDGEAVVGAAST